MNIGAGLISSNCSSVGEWKAIDQGKVEHEQKRKRPSNRVDKQKMVKLAPQTSKPPTSKHLSVSKSLKDRTNTPNSPSKVHRVAHKRNDLSEEKQSRFQIFVPVLLQYLDDHNPSLHEQAKALVQNWYSRTRLSKGERPHDIDSLKDRLQALVRNKDWTRAEVYFRQYMEEQKKQNAQQGLSVHESDTATPNRSSASPSSNSRSNNDNLDKAFDRHMISLKKLMKAYYPNGGYVLSSECKCDKTLWGWIGHIRHSYRNKDSRKYKKNRKLTDDQIAQLEAIGFLWEDPFKSPGKSASNSQPRGRVPTPKSTPKSTKFHSRSKNSSASKEETPTSNRKRGKPKKRDSLSQLPIIKEGPDYHDDPIDLDNEAIRDERKESTSSATRDSIESLEKREAECPRDPPLVRNDAISTEEGNSDASRFDSLSKEDLIRLYLEQRDYMEYLRTDRDFLKSQLETSKMEKAALQRIAKRMDNEMGDQDFRASKQTSARKLQKRTRGLQFDDDNGIFL